MPKQARYDIKRKLEFAIKDIEAAQGLIIAVAIPFEVVHADYFQAFSLLVKALEDVKLSVAVMSDKI